MDRRNFLAAGGVAAAGMTLTPGMASAMDDAAKKSSSMERSLKGDFLDLTTSEGNREAWARLLGNTDSSKTKYGFAEGLIRGVRPGEALREKL